MIVPTLNVLQHPVIGQNGLMTPQWQLFMTQLIQQLQINFSNEGIVVPTLSSDPASVTPAESGGQIGQLESNQYVQNGTLIYDEFTNQLKVRLSDTNFYTITTS